MRIRLFSDLHLEMAEFEPPATACDVVVLAGDIHTRGRGLEWATDRFPDTPVLYVPGNHEYYGQTLQKHLQALMKESDGTNDVVFLGCTLWTDFQLFGEPRVAGYEASRVVTDFRRIRTLPNYSKFSPLEAAVLHRRSRDWLRERLEQYAGRRIVVATHHAPSARSLPEEYADDLVSAAYASNLDEFVEGYAPLLWLHGHVHTANDYFLGSTHVVSNPRGYPGEETGFRPDLVLEV
jgi:Icc-related predicted phosphoesterase